MRVPPLRAFRRSPCASDFPPPHVFSVRGAALVLALCAALAGCGKALTPQGAEHGSGPPAALSAHGAGGLSTKNTTRLGGTTSAIDAAAVAVAVYPGLTPATRPPAVVLVDSGNWPAALAASALAGRPLHAPLLYSDGGVLPEASALALRVMRPAGVPGSSATDALRSAQAIQIGAAATPSGYVTRSLPGGDSATLAVEVERLLSTLRNHPPHQLIVTAADGPRAMTMPAAGLAAQTGAPILFVNRSVIPPATSAELARLGRTAIYVVGPGTVVGENVVRKLGRYGSVTRISGANPASNAIAVARFSDGTFGWGVVEPGHGLVFANASRPFDGPAAALLSSVGDYGPPLLLESSEQIPAGLGSYLSDLQPGSPPAGPVHGVYNHGWLIGGEGAISASIQASLDDRLEIAPRPAAEPPIAASTTSTPASEPTQTIGP